MKSRSKAGTWRNNQTEECMCHDLFPELSSTWSSVPCPITSSGQVSLIFRQDPLHSDDDITQYMWHSPLWSVASLLSSVTIYLLSFDFLPSELTYPWAISSAHIHKLSCHPCASQPWPNIWSLSLWREGAECSRRRNNRHPKGDKVPLMEKDDSILLIYPPFWFSMLVVVPLHSWLLLGISLKGFVNWLQLMCCTYLLSMSKYFVWIGLKSRVWYVLQYIRVWYPELSLGSREPERDEWRVEHKARVWRS